MTKIYVPCLCVTLLCFVSEFLDLNVFLHWLQGIATSCKWLISMWLLIAPIISSFPNVFEWRSQDCLIDDDDLRRMANVNGHASNVLWRDVDGVGGLADSMWRSPSSRSGHLTWQFSKPKSYDRANFQIFLQLTVKVCFMAKQNLWNRVQTRQKIFSKKTC